VFLGSAIRAIAPWLLMPAAVLVSFLLAGLDALTYSRTDRAAAQEAITSGRQERFTWIEASHFKPSKHGAVLVRLFA
jgi:hypothetical protein